MPYICFGRRTTIIRGFYISTSFNTHFHFSLLVRIEVCTYIEAPDDGRSTTETYIGHFK
jgi:hypothetical protein